MTMPRVTFRKSGRGIVPDARGRRRPFHTLKVQVNANQFEQARVPLAYGFFSICTQALLFRAFLSAFDGSELAFGIFFASWLIWIALGAWVGQRTAPRLVPRFPAWCLLYIPLFVGQFFLLGSMRRFAGVSAYEIFPLPRLAFFAFIANAPVSLLTGLLFPSAAEWLRQQSDEKSAVSHLYAWEAFGSVVGGLFATLLLAWGCSSEETFLASTIPFTMALTPWRKKSTDRLSRWLPRLVLLVCVILFATQTGNRWARLTDVRTWQRLLPAKGFRGHFTTPQARYLYGTYDQQFNVMAWNSVCESVPNRTYAGEIFALSMAQQPRARRVLVIGENGLSICQAFLALPQIEQTVWLHPDPTYPDQLLNILPPEHFQGLKKLELSALPVRRALETSTNRFDLVLVNIPRAMTLADNRFFTREFFSLIQSRLSKEGVLCVQTPGGENVMGDELRTIGASMYLTLGRVFPHRALKPGDSSWVMASSAPLPEQKPKTLTRRYASIPQADTIFPPAGLSSLYPADRVQFQLAAYQEVIDTQPESFLLNTDTRPRLLLYSLLFSGRQTDTRLQLLSIAQALTRAGPALFIALTFLFAVLRVFQRRFGTRKTTSLQQPIADVLILIFSTGLASLSISLVLMFMLQARYAAMFLLMGLVSALFMTGLFLGCRIIMRLPQFSPRYLRRLLAISLLLNTGFCLLLLFLPDHIPLAAMTLLFLLAGMLSGVFIPLAERLLIQHPSNPAQIASQIERADTLGGALGGIATGLLLLPLLGIAGCLPILATIIGLNLMLLPIQSTAQSAPSAVTRICRNGGIVLTWFVLGWALAFHLIPETPEPLPNAPDSPLRQAAEKAFPELTYHLKAQDSDEAPWSYLTAKTPDGKTLYIVETQPLTGPIHGYGGPINLMLVLDNNGTIQHVGVLDSHETPAFMDIVLEWLPNLHQQNAYDSHTIRQVDTISGATITSGTILDIVEKAGTRFRQRLRSNEPTPDKMSFNGRPTPRFLLLSGLIIGALFLRRTPTRRRRLIWLAFIIIGPGLLLNIQYSMDQVGILLHGRWPIDGLELPLLMVLGIPLIVLLFGNIYCGWLCPFGALQELIGEFRPQRYRTDPPSHLLRLARPIKYALFFLIAFVMLHSGERDVAEGDPLVSLFSHNAPKTILILSGILLLLSVFYRRFWCRCLCPTGAFLALLNSAQLLRRWLPRLPWRRCDLGVTASTDLDCLCCDRCRIAARRKPKGSPRTKIILTDAVGIAATIACAAWLVHGVATSGPSPTASPAAPLHEQKPGPDTTAPAPLPAKATARPATGKPRDVDMPRLRQKIRSGQLSDHEALYYTPLNNNHR